MVAIAIRRENKSRWERRTPLTPAHVRQIVAQGIDVVVQPSPVRIFTDAEYQHAGAQVHEAIDACPIVFGVKEMPADSFQPDRTYVFFSHTHKAQPYNMPMLRRVIDQGATLIDYELITDHKGQRLIFFGRYAGLAGMLDTLWALGRRLEAEGLRSPFAAVRRAWEYSDLNEARQAIYQVGATISKDGLPEEITPLVCGFAGYGRVSLGAQEIYDLLPVRSIDPEDLAAFRAGGEASPHFLYKSVFREEHMYRRRDGGAFDFGEFVASPERYEARFEELLPHIDVLLHGIYWEERYPELMSRDFLRRCWSAPTRPRLRVIGDVTCDIRGSLACTIRPADTDHPVYVYRPEDDTAVEAFDGPGPLVLAVDNLPCELPRDASEEFGSALLPFIARLARAHENGAAALEDLPDEIRRAVIVHRGRLTEAHAHLAEHLPG
ncbi:MAG: bifunctional lysine ketoglutarate reductase /saccharopine dehydrogenase family protein [Acidobacteriota bacterium]|nr:bifunctional lysine ketoglutarate reductase /saccharopine dehydrogenase family protein [Acidobacteriota bacterium]